jgi:tellurite resistance protein
MENFFPEIELSAQQAEVMARGMFAVARAEGGVHEKEKALLMSFYADTAEGESARSLSLLENAPDPTPAEIASALTSRGHEVLFLKTCILMAYADNEFGANERDLVGRYALALGVSMDELKELERDVKSYLMSSLVRLSNVEAVVEVAKKLGVTD